MALHIGNTALDFGAKATKGKIRFHAWIGDEWAVLFPFPKDLATWRGSSRNSTSATSRFWAFRESGREPREMGDGYRCGATLSGDWRHRSQDRKSLRLLPDSGFCSCAGSMARATTFGAKMVQATA